MSGELNNPPEAPPPPVAQPAQEPGLFSAALALAVSAGQLLRANGSGRGAALALAAVGSGFFLGRRLSGARIGLLTAAVLAAMTAGFDLGGKALLAILLAVVGLWWTLRFRDDRAPANAIVVLAALAGLAWLVVQGV